MNLENHQNVNPGVTPNLQAVPAVPQPAVSSSVSPKPLEANLAEQVSAQAKRLAAQYQNDPYRLCSALQQLKAKYLSDQFQITSKAAEE